ncbi:ROK family protein, partial [Streptococcus equi]|uniref:ROK family protein n=1 Tax=Streptococcus equi TaxID=1336 RepID=UPI0020A7B4F1
DLALCNTELNPFTNMSCPTFGGQYSLAMGVFNIQLAFDPEMILIGGGVSQADFLLPALEAELDKLYQIVSISDLRPQLAICHFKNEANLLGASIDFMQEHRKDEMWID